MRSPVTENAREQAAFRKTQTAQYDSEIADAARSWRLDPFLLKGLLFTESKLNPNAVSKRMYEDGDPVGGGARGIGQFTNEGVSAVNENRRRRMMVGEEVEPFTASQVMDPRYAIPATAELLSSYLEWLGRDGGITAYNSGPRKGRLVSRLGFHAARRTGKLHRSGRVVLQGHRFLLRVLRTTNSLRVAAGLRALEIPKSGRRRRNKR